jgi:hypothetical protein
MDFSTSGLIAYVTHDKTARTEPVHLLSGNTRNEDEVKAATERIAKGKTQGVM